MWILFALCASLLSSIYYLSIQNLNIDKNLFMVYRGLSITVMLLPLLFLYPVFFSLNFYAMSITQGIIVAYTDYLTFNINKKYGAETVSSITPFSVVIVFFMWCIIRPASIVHYTQNIPNTCCILLSLFGTVFALFKYHQVEFSRKALYALLPILFLSSIIAVLNKMIMDYSMDELILCACQRAFVVSAVIGIIHLYIYKKKKLPFRNLFIKNNMLKIYVFAISLSFLLFKSFAMYFTINPAYVSCLICTSLIWTMIFGKYIPIFKFAKANQQGEKKWKLLFLASIILLIITTH